MFIPLQSFIISLQHSISAGVVGSDMKQASWGTSAQSTATLITSTRNGQIIRKVYMIAHFQHWHLRPGQVLMLSCTAPSDARRDRIVPALYIRIQAGIGLFLHCIFRCKQRPDSSCTASYRYKRGSRSSLTASANTGRDRSVPSLYL